MKNECVFYDKPRMAYVSDHQEHPDSDKTKGIIIGFIAYNGTKYHLFADSNIYSWRYVTFIDEPVEKPRRIEDGLKYGDIIINEDGKRKVLGVVNDVIFLSDNYNFDRMGYADTLSQLIRHEYKLVSDVEPIEEVEMTVAEISKELNKRVKIVE